MVSPQSAAVSSSPHQFIILGKPWFKAKKFFESLTSDDGPEFKGVKYSVFGCGLNVFPETYQFVPKVSTHVAPIKAWVLIIALLLPIWHQDDR